MFYEYIHTYEKIQPFINFENPFQITQNCTIFFCRVAMAIGQRQLFSNFSRMGQELFSIFKLEKKRLLGFISITIAIILVFQYLELPYGAVQPTVFSGNMTPTLDSTRFLVVDVPSNSETIKNMTSFNQANSTGENAREIVNITKTSEVKDTISSTGFISEPARESGRSLEFGVTDESSTEESTQKSNNGSATDRTGNLGLSIYNNNVSHSLSHLAPPSPTNVSQNITPPMLSNDYDETEFTEDERFKLVGNNSSISSMPKETKGSQIPLLEVTTISEMNELLLQNRASYRSMVNDLMPFFFSFYDLLSY